MDQLHGLENLINTEPTLRTLATSILRDLSAMGLNSAIVSEVFNPGKFCSEALKQCLEPGFAADLQTLKRDGNPLVKGDGNPLSVS